MHITRDAAPETDLKVYEKKSYYMGVLPGFLLTLGSGMWMLLQAPTTYFQAYGGTFHAKLTLVFVLIVADQFFHQRMRRFHQNGTGTRKVFMAIHGVVGLSFILIVLLIEGRYLG